MKNLTFSNFFSEFYFLHPVSDKTVNELGEKDREIVLISTIALGVFTFGIIHLGAWIIEKCISSVEERTEVDKRVQNTYQQSKHQESSIDQSQKTKPKKKASPQDLKMHPYTGMSNTYYERVKPALEEFIKDYSKAFFFIDAWGQTRKDLPQGFFDEVEANNPDRLPVVFIILRDSDLAIAEKPMGDYMLPGGVCTVFMNAYEGKLIKGESFDQAKIQIKNAI